MSKIGNGLGLVHLVSSPRRPDARIQHVLLFSPSIHILMLSLRIPMLWAFLYEFHKVLILDIITCRSQLC